LKIGCEQFCSHLPLHGTRAMLEAEGVIPPGIVWPRFEIARARRCLKDAIYRHSEQGSTERFAQWVRYCDSTQDPASVVQGHHSRPRTAAVAVGKIG
jgi:hypothetical protein